MIRHFEVKGLYNRIDVSIDFNSDLNIITGRNGSGKTTLLKLIWYLISGNLERIIPEIPFNDVSIETDVFRLDMMQIDGDKCAIDYRFVNEDNSTLDFEVPPRRAEDKQIDALNLKIAEAMQSSLFFPTFRRIEGGFGQLSTYHWYGGINKLSPSKSTPEESSRWHNRDASRINVSTFKSGVGF